MSIGGLDGPHALQSAAEAQRLQRLGAEAARGEEQAQRFAGLLEEVRRQQRVAGPGAAADARRSGRGDESGPQAGRETPDEPVAPLGGDGRRRGRGRAGGGREGHGQDGSTGPAPPGRGPVPEDLPVKGRHLDRTV
ncbi:P-type conjugative transfer protein TrbL [Thermaerobacter marianensis DSM 12885]|uniref:P-type conjugative transfer protein TrbL n=1 Tax=Thermaerobacter marianensis (strain ATCC 700841 / DSM 12885 / JCM 10246 / 7p75a) TaxID=644966 RepID=E6SJQ1_THEM7|nr:hypothetical protein [Thermaerobacter marianensis]ADU51114.1 P-type conjugative transfer protein TrbL [Thermaerobacter marianensis DSM 12885]